MAILQTKEQFRIYRRFARLCSPVIVIFLSIPLQKFGRSRKEIGSVVPRHFVRCPIAIPVIVVILFWSSEKLP